MCLVAIAKPLIQLPPFAKFKLIYRKSSLKPEYFLLGMALNMKDVPILC